MTEIQLLEGVQRTFTDRICGLENMNYWERLSQFTSKDDVTAAQMGSVYHSDDVEDPSQCCPQLQQY